MSSIGQSIVENFEFISNVCAECEQLTALLKQEMEALISTDIGFPKSMRAGGNWIESSDMDASGWLYTAAGYSLPIRVGAKRNPSRYLCFQISLSGDGIAVVDNCEPLVHVAWWTVPLDFEEYAMEFPLDAQETLSLKDQVLFTWSSDLPEDTEWAYSMKLMSLNTIQDIKEKITEPVKKLLTGRSVEEALPLTMDGLVKYAVVDNQPGQFRII